MHIIAGQKDSLIIWRILYHTDNTLESFRMLVWDELPFHHVFEDINLCWDPLCIGSTCHPHLSIKSWSVTKNDTSKGDTLNQSEVAQYYLCQHDPHYWVSLVIGFHLRCKKFCVAIIVILEVDNVTIN